MQYVYNGGLGECLPALEWFMASVGVGWVPSLGWPAAGIVSGQDQADQGIPCRM